MREPLRCAGWMLVLFASGCGSRTSLGGLGGLTATGGTGATGGSSEVGGTGGNLIASGGVVSGGAPPSGGAPNSGGVSGGGSGGGLVMECPRGSFDADEQGPRPCEPCPMGTYSSFPDSLACTVWTECLWEEVERTSPSPLSDRTCGPGSSVRQIGTDSVEQLLDVAVDEAGNVYVAGYTYGSLDAVSTGDADAMVRKYSPAGEVLWAHQWGGPDPDTAYGVDLDDHGRVHVLGSQISFSALWTFDVDGLLLAEHSYAANVSDLAVAPAGDRYITRPLPLTGGSYDIELSRLAADGSAVWTMVMNGGDVEWPNAVAVLPSGDVVIAGSTDGPLFQAPLGERDAFVARFAPGDGSLRWGMQFGAGTRTNVSRLAVDSTEDLLITGNTQADSQSPSDGFVARVTSEGTLEWVSVLGSSGVDLVQGVAIDALDQVTVSGQTLGSLGSDNLGAHDGFVAHVLENGDFGSVIQFGSSGDDYADAIAAAPDGAWFVVGATNGAFEGWENEGSLDAYVLRVAPF